MPLRTLVVCCFMGGLLNVSAAIAGTCTAPDAPVDCSQDCGTWKACLQCCTQARTSASVCRSACAPLFGASEPRVGGDPQSRVQRPARPARPVRTRPTRRPGAQAAPTPPRLDPAGFSATCNLEQAADRVWVHLQVTNETGAALTTVAARASACASGGGRAVVAAEGADPPRVCDAGDRGAASSSGGRDDCGSGGAVGISTAASAVAPNGTALLTRQVDCGTLGGTEPRSGEPTATPTPGPLHPASGAATAEAAQCANCHERPHMAFVANMWRESGHASTNGRGRDNTFCANCHSPLQADAAASATKNAAIPVSQWQGVTCSVCHPSRRGGRRVEYAHRHVRRGDPHPFSRPVG